jgi:uncharacterized protein with HEPN domain
MSIRKSEKIVLQKLIREISIVDDITKRYSREEFLKDVIVQRAVAMTIINIGELTTVLSEDFRDAYPQVPWRKIKGLRNIMAHKYQIVDFEDVWETAVKSIPELEEQLCEILRDYK